MTQTRKTVMSDADITTRCKSPYDQELIIYIVCNNLDTEPLLFSYHFILIFFGGGGGGGLVPRYSLWLFVIEIKRKRNKDYIDNINND